MKTLVVYDSRNGKTEFIARKIPGIVKNINDDFSFDNFDLIVFVCPTYGDEELPPEMEKFIICLDVVKKFTVCETGNYYGFDDFSFGARKIIENWLKDSGWEMLNGFSLDTYEPINWRPFEKWIESLYERS
jgi:flavodoxin